MKFSLRLNADDTYGMVKQQLTQRCGIPSYLLKLVQINGSNIKVNNYFEYMAVHREILLACRNNFSRDWKHLTLVILVTV